MDHFVALFLSPAGQDMDTKWLSLSGLLYWPFLSILLLIFEVWYWCLCFVCCFSGYGDTVFASNPFDDATSSSAPMQMPNMGHMGHMGMMPRGMAPGMQGGMGPGPSGPMGPGGPMGHGGPMGPAGPMGPMGPNSMNGPMSHGMGHGPNMVPGMPGGNGMGPGMGPGGNGMGPMVPRMSAPNNLPAGQNPMNSIAGSMNPMTTMGGGMHDLNMPGIGPGGGPAMPGPGPGSGPAGMPPNSMPNSSRKVTCRWNSASTNRTNMTNRTGSKVQTRSCKLTNCTSWADWRLCFFFRIFGLHHF